ncbi:MAG: recombinase XerC [Gammaproteobacteria bacterium]|nr:recombinase XerC [Gammaproteobacteria bacterium]|tara:strand:+ start:195144 stop:196244 length:1101 start_codon:yes stop_codon:yes gene_type:complete
MKNHNPVNERIKHKYRRFLKEARQQSEASVDAVERALAQFEGFNAYKDFKRFHHQQAVAFKKYLGKQTNPKTGKPLSKSTMNRTMNCLKAFLQWLAREPGYKSAINYSDAEYFNMSEKDVRVATAKRQKRYPSLEQIKEVLSHMPFQTDIQKRDKALIAFSALTGARDSAIASFKLKHLDMEAGLVHQDARDVKTKFSKTFDTVFFEVGDDIKQILQDWVDHLKNELLWADCDPLFPSTKIEVIQNSGFQATGLKREHWKNAGPIRRIFRESFQAAGLPTFNPHSFRDTLTSLGFKRCKSPEQFKAWSKNLGHEDVLTTLTNYGDISHERQKEIIQNLNSSENPSDSDVEEIARAVIKEMKKTKGE